MAGTATHLAVADKITEKLSEASFLSLPEFYSGNIAPDAVHSRAGYKREYKKETHLTVGLSGADFVHPEKRAIFHQRLREYIERYYRKGEAGADLYLGYITHLVTDEYFNIHIRTQFSEKMAKEGITNEDPEFAKRILSDMDRVDRILMIKYPFGRDVRAILDGVWDYEIRDMVTAGEVNASKRWVIDKLFCESEDMTEPVYYSYAEALCFIESTANAIIERFTSGEEFPVLF